MLYNPRLFIDGKENFDLKSYTITYPGTNQLNNAKIQLTDPVLDGNTLFGKIVELYTNCGSENNIPTFRGIIKVVNTSDTEISLNCLDVRAYISGNDGKKISFDELNNYDGFSISQYLKSYIEQEINTKDRTFIGTDMLSDTKKCSNMTGVRGEFSVLDAAVQRLDESFDDDDDEPLRYIFDVVEGPLYSNLVLRKQRLLTEKPSLSLSLRDGIASFNYKRRPSPQDILITNSENELSTNIKLSGANHGPFSATLQGKFQDTSSARNAGILELKKLQQEIDEIGIEITRGYDIGLESLVFVNVDNDEIDGIHRVVGKTITGSNMNMKVNLNLNKRPVKVSQYLSKA